MHKLIRNGLVVTDTWKTLTLSEYDTPHTVKLPVGPVLVPLSVWLARRSELIHREYEHGWPLGIWLAAEEDAEAIMHDIDDFTVIAVEFDKFTDGKSYSTARLLRKRFGYKGELRAIGDVPRDKLTFQHQVGFDTFSMHANQKIGAILSGAFDFTSAKHTHPQLSAIAG